MFRNVQSDLWRAQRNRQVSLWCRFPPPSYKDERLHRERMSPQQRSRRSESRHPRRRRLHRSQSRGPWGVLLVYPHNSVWTPARMFLLHRRRVSMHQHRRPPHNESNTTSEHVSQNQTGPPLPRLFMGASWLKQTGSAVHGPTGKKRQPGPPQ